MTARLFAPCFYTFCPFFLSPLSTSFQLPCTWEIIILPDARHLGVGSLRYNVYLCQILHGAKDSICLLWQPCSQLASATPPVVPEDSRVVW